LSLINLTRKQDLPFYSYGEKTEWNWVSIGGMDS